MLRKNPPSDFVQNIYFLNKIFVLERCFSSAVDLILLESKKLNPHRRLQYQGFRGFSEPFCAVPFLGSTCKPARETLSRTLSLSPKTYFLAPLRCFTLGTILRTKLTGGGRGQGDPFPRKRGEAFAPNLAIALYCTHYRTIEA